MESSSVARARHVSDCAVDCGSWRRQGQYSASGTDVPAESAPPSSDWQLVVMVAMSGVSRVAAHWSGTAL